MGSESSRSLRNEIIFRKKERHSTPVIKFLNRKKRVLCDENIYCGWPFKMLARQFCLVFVKNLISSRHVNRPNEASHFETFMVLCSSEKLTGAICKTTKPYT